MSSMSELPRCVAFRSDQNGSYLRYVHGSDGKTFLESSGEDCISPHTRFYVEPSKENDGLVHIRCCYNNKYWAVQQQQEGDVGGWIIHTVHELEDDLSKPSCTLFKLDPATENQPQSVRFLLAQLGKHVSMFSSSNKTNNNYLYNLGNNNFCKRLWQDGIVSCLNAGTTTITTEAKLKLEEAVVSRKIYGVDFDLSNYRIYGNEVLNMSTASAVNRTTEKNTAKLTLSYKEASMSTWDSTVSWKLSVTTTVKAGVPVVAEESVEIKNEFSGEYKWGSSLEKTTEQQIEYELIVPPMSKVTVSLIASKASCDVPFSYKQEDVLYDGRVVTYDMDDGIYTGINCYDFKYETKEENI
ncbi:hypothetical protein GUJ93_ZPchr0173g47695 [Zizania palustris]|uniref:Agglutinin domain-containing protein n=1 Tax=Zizania palustris TaxID=103762 RepID=A0A8J5SVR6_ZIZPA|nr:hypothetical protein GUJ93_ZPchr0173g47695 [Zizania palustris]